MSSPATPPTDAAPEPPQPAEPPSGRHRPRRSRRGWIAALTVLVVAVGGLVAFLVTRNDHFTPSAVPYAGPPPAVPTSGAYLGAWVGPTVFTQNNRVSAVSDLENQVGSGLSIVQTYHAWDKPIGTSSDHTLATSGRYLMISWASDDIHKITSGADDAIIADRARQIADLKSPVFLRFRWEMDRPNLKSTIHSPQQFIKAWDRVRSIFTQMKVSNVSWVWCPTAVGFASGRAQKYYPGDDEVDWVCADGYAYPGSKTGPQSFASIIAPFMAWDADHHKPAMIGEFGVDKTYGAARGPWLAAIPQVLTDNPDLKALVYFDDTGTTGNYEIEGDPAFTAAFAALAKAPQIAQGAPR